MAEPASAAASPRLLFRHGAVLGLVTLVAPLAMNMYVPALPAMAGALRTDAAGMQFSLVSFLIALAGGQIAWGAVSDRFGRKGPLLAGLILFAAASIGASRSHTIAQFVLWRFAQGFGACAAQAIPRAMIRDMHSGPAAARLMGFVLLVIAIAPLFAPMIGSGLIAVLPWASLFWLMAAAGVVALILVALCLTETLPHDLRARGGPANVWRGFLALLGHRSLMLLTLTLAFGQASFYAYLGASSFVMLVRFGLAPWQYSVVFAIAAAGWAGAAQTAPLLMRRFGPPRTARTASGIGALVMVLLLAAAAVDIAGLGLLVVAVTIYFSALGILNPILTVLALDQHGRSAGMASAVIGTTAFGMGALSSALVSTLADGTEMPMLAVMAGLAAAALATCLMALPMGNGAEGRRRPAGML